MALSQTHVRQIRALKSEVNCMARIGEDFALTIWTKNLGPDDFEVLLHIIEKPANVKIVWSGFITFKMPCDSRLDVINEFNIFCDAVLCIM